MIEVEVRARIDDLGSIQNTLNNLGAKSQGVKRQIDKIYGHDMFLDADHKIIEGGVVPRIRQVNDVARLDFKEIVRQGGGFELRIDLPNMELGERLLSKLQFNEAFTIDKIRTTYIYQDFKIALDQVERLGLFIEIEKNILQPELINEARQACLDLLEQIIPGAISVDQKYGDMIQDLINQGDRGA